MGLITYLNSSLSLMRPDLFGRSLMLSRFGFVVKSNAAMVSVAGELATGRFIGAAELNIHLFRSEKPAAPDPSA
jgi:hypothetical protein